MFRACRREAEESFQGFQMVKTEGEGEGQHGGRPHIWNNQDGGGRPGHRQETVNEAPLTHTELTHRRTHACTQSVKADTTETGQLPGGRERKEEWTGASVCPSPSFTHSWVGTATPLLMFFRRNHGSKRKQPPTPTPHQPMAVTPRAGARREGRRHDGAGG